MHCVRQRKNKIGSRDVNERHALIVNAPRMTWWGRVNVFEREEEMGGGFLTSCRLHNNDANRENLPHVHVVGEV